MSRLTLRELHRLGLAWPPGPVTPPDDHDASFDLRAEAIGCESLYHDYKGDNRYRDQKALFEELAAKVAAKRAVTSFGRPVTRRKLASLGLAAPACMYIPDYEDAELDLEAIRDTLAKDLATGTRARDTVEVEKHRVETLMQELDRLGVPWRDPMRAAPRIEPPITKRKIESLGLEWPWPYPFDLDDPLDLERAMADLTYGDLMDYTGGRGTYLDDQRRRTKAIIDRLDALGVAWRPNAKSAESSAPAVRTSPGFPAAPPAPPARPDPAPPTSKIEAPFTRRKLAALGVPLPQVWSYEAEDATIDVAWHLENLETHVAEGRPGYDGDLRAARNVVKRLEELGVAWRTKSAPAARRTVTRRMLRERGLSLPFSTDIPFALDEPIDLDAAVAQLSGTAKGAVEKIIDVLADPLALVLARPDDMAPRLAYAATLGDANPRAQFIRLQCEASELPSWDPRFRVLSGRWIHLLVREGKQWDALIGELTKYKTYRRGFVEAIEIDGKVFAAHADRLLARAPIFEVSCTTNVDALAGAPALRKIRNVRCEGDASAIVTSEHVSSTRSLWLSKGRVGDAFDLAAQSKTLSSLEELRAWQVEDLARIVVALAATPDAFPRLRDLTLHGPPIDERALRALVGTALAPRLEELHVRIAGAESGAALVERELPSLVRLGIDGAGATPVAALAGLRAPKVADLALYECAFDEEGGRALARVPFDGLRKLAITGRGIDAATSNALASAPWLATLETIAMRGVACAADVAPVLARTSAMLRALQIEANDFSGLAGALAESPGAASLVTLRVGSSIPARELEAALARTPNLRGLELVVPWDAPTADQSKVLVAADFEPSGGEKGCWVRHLSPATRA